jgi:23S rRNA pseudouridine2605 synthase
MTRKFRRHSARSKASGSDAREGRDASAPGAERLQKVLAAAGVGSRRDCEELIRDGRVEVDRKVVTELGTRVDPLAQEIRVDGEALRRPKRLYFAVNKPEGVVTTNYDQSGRPRVVDLVPTQERVFAVGRLDMASEGLILVTNDGEFANRLTHPRYGVPKTYLVRVAGTPSQTELAKLRRGIHLAEGLARVNTLHVKGKHKGSTDMVIVLNEGRNREIRRILARIGHKVLRLKRIAVGKLKLSDLPVGAWRRLMPKEIEMLLSEAQERKRERRQPKRPAGTIKPVQGKREPSPYLPEQAAMAPGPMGGELEDEWDGDDDFLGGDEGMIEITDDAATFGGRPPRGDVIDYEEAPTPLRRPQQAERQQPKPHAHGRKPGGRAMKPGGRAMKPGGRAMKPGGRATKSGGHGSQSGRRPQKGNRPSKNRPKGRR